VVSVVGLVGRLPVPPSHEPLPVNTSPITTTVTSQLAASQRVIDAEEVDDDDSVDAMDVGRPADPSQLIIAALSAATRELLQPLPTTSTPTFPAVSVVEDASLLHESGFPTVSPVANVSMKVLDETKDVSDDDDEAAQLPQLQQECSENARLSTTLASSYTQDSFEEVDEGDDDGLPEPHEASEHYSDGEFD
jgi:hypothetical protein